MIEVYGLAGKSGSGKSYQAINLCKERGIECILDDGLLITRGSILSGVSAKRQETKIRAIRTALFTDDAHRDDVIKKIEEVNPASILILGTSQKMIERIAARLDLPLPAEIISINKITTLEERRIASRERHEMGKHVIPVPAFQLKKEFSGYFMHPLRIIKGLRGNKDRSVERSVVRPSFSYLGRYNITNRAISEIVIITGSFAGGIESIFKVNVDTDKTGVTISMSVTIEYGVHVIETATNIQKKVADMLEEMTAFNIKAVNIDVKGLVRVRDDNF